MYVCIPVPSLSGHLTVLLDGGFSVCMYTCALSPSYRTREVLTSCPRSTTEPLMSSSQVGAGQGGAGQGRGGSGYFSLVAGPSACVHLLYM